jgi:hypothetical protein
MDDRPYFLWDVPVTETGLRERLRDPDPRIRAQWQGVVLREACYRDVWKYLSLSELVRDWSFLERHLGRRRRFWSWLLESWRRDGLLAS